MIFSELMARVGMKGEMHMMEHYIIVKFTGGTDVKALVEPVRGIFEETLEIPGVHSLDIRVSNSDIANRFDLMIIITMEKEIGRAHV